MRSPQREEVEPHRGGGGNQKIGRKRRKAGVEEGKG